MKLVLMAVLVVAVLVMFTASFPLNSGVAQIDDLDANITGNDNNMTDTNINNLPESGQISKRN